MKLYNTTIRGVEEFRPIKENTAGIYTCGPTVYNYAHIGNLRTYIFEDILKRALLFNGYKVNHIMNITDVGHLVSDADSGEDKMEKGASREGKTVWEIARQYEEAFKDDFHALNCLDPDVWCRATEHIEEQIGLVKKLEENGVTYRIDDGIYFDTSKFPRYAEFARLDLDKMKAGARVEMAQGKRNPPDFALWKFSPKDKKRQMEWESPWGTGFPGWHIECSAMSMKYLGETFDIHCGGIDHIPVHHTNEIAQAEAATGKKCVNYWLHGEFLVMDQEKMAKSGAGFITLQTLKDKGFDPLDYRYFCFSAHYRMPLNFAWEGLEAARNTLKGLRERVWQYMEDSEPEQTEKSEKAIAAVKDNINDDLNIPKALATLWITLKDSSLSPAEKLAFVEKADAVLGLDLLKEKKEEILDTDIQQLIDERLNARKEKNFSRADDIRDTLAAKGILLEDGPDGTRWKRK